MTWSHGQVLAQTRERLASLEVDTLLLPSWFDVDTPDDLRYLQSVLGPSLEATMPNTVELLRRLVCIIQRAAWIDDLRKTTLEAEFNCVKIKRAAIHIPIERVRALLPVKRNRNGLQTH